MFSQPNVEPLVAAFRPSDCSICSHVSPGSRRKSVQTSKPITPVRTFDPLFPQSYVYRLSCYHRARKQQSSCFEIALATPSPSTAATTATTTDPTITLNSIDSPAYACLFFYRRIEFKSESGTVFFTSSLARVPIIPRKCGAKQRT